MGRATLPFVIRTSPRFSLIHPSRGRVDAAQRAIREWTGHAARPDRIEYLLSVDESDDQNAYRGVAEHEGVRLVVGPNRSPVDAVERAARLAVGRILIVVSDDFGCPTGWDDQLLAVTDGLSGFGVLVHDGMDARIMTLPIIDRVMYERLGHLYCPRYLSMFADDDLTEAVRRFGHLIDARHLLFPHRHVTVGLAPDDDTYRRQHRVEVWWQGWRMFQRRKATNFGRARWTPGVIGRVAAIDAYYFGRFTLSRLRRLWRRLAGPPTAAEERMRKRVLRWLERLARVTVP
jgi:hypothetical protein